MVRMTKRWKIAPVWPECQEAGRRWGVSPLIAQLLYNRGMAHPDKVKAFLNPDIKCLYPPETLPGTRQAAELIAHHALAGKSIVIYGDYDVDGIAGTAILWHVLSLAGARVSNYVPHRLEEGYGLNSEALRQLRGQGADLVITVDCGITAVEQALLAKQIGLSLVITDHHRLEGSLPEADAIVHPLIDPGYPNPNLCGAGVAFKLAWALARILSRSERVRPHFREFLVDAVGLVALATIADIVPLVDENRILARFGLAGLATTRLTGVTALIEAAGLTDQKVNTEHVGFRLAPRLNAAGRMGHALEVIEMLTLADPTRARQIACSLEQQNEERKAVEQRILDEACERIQTENLASDGRRGIVLASEGWHAGVIGIVAMRVVERFGRPTILIALENGKGQGSARSIQHFDLHRALTDCREHLLTCGGHAMAAGLKIEPDRIERFTEVFIEKANQRLTAQDLEPPLRLDAEVDLASLTEQTVHDIGRLAPFGMGNPEPRFSSQPLSLENEPHVFGKNGNHLYFHVTDGRIRLKAIAWNGKDLLPVLLEHRRFQMAFVPVTNTFNGRTSVELRVEDVAFIN